LIFEAKLRFPLFASLRSPNNKTNSVLASDRYGGDNYLYNNYKEWTPVLQESPWIYVYVVIPTLSPFLFILYMFIQVAKEGILFNLMKNKYKSQI